MISDSIQINGQTFYSEVTLHQVAEMTKACFDITEYNQEYRAWIQKGRLIFNAKGSTVWEAVKSVHDKAEKHYE